MKEYFNKEYLLSNKNKIIKAAVIILLVIVAFFSLITGKTGDGKEDIKVKSSEKQETVFEEPEKNMIIVDIDGAVLYPQVVEIEEGSRVADAIKAAGGLTEDADTTQINQAAVLNDGEKILIPRKGEAVTGFMSTGTISQQASVIDINTATSEELQTLNGVGPATAEKIIKYRTDVGYFKSIEDIKNVDGIGDKTFEKLKDYIRV